MAGGAIHLRRYAAEIWILAFIAAALAATEPMPAVSGSTLLAQVLGASLAFERARRAVRPYAAAPATIREAEIGPRLGLPGGLLAQLGPFLILFATVAYVGLHWDDVPARFPTHWNLAGTPNGWTPKSVAAVFRGPAIGVIVCTMMWFTSTPSCAGPAFHASPAQRPAESPRPPGQPRRPARIRYLLALLLRMDADGIAVCRRRQSAAAAAPVPRRPVRRAHRRHPRHTRDAANRRCRWTAGGRLDARWCWVFGRLYVNRADPALFMERRLGPGYTLNLGNPWSWLVMCVFVVALAIPLLLVP